MTQKKKEILVVGLLVLLVARLFFPHAGGFWWDVTDWEFEGFSLSLLATLSGVWACVVWLWK